MTDAAPTRDVWSQVPDRVWTALVWALLVALICWSVVERLRVLESSPYPLGIDGYFYPVQLRALLTTGHLAYPASPLAFWVLAPFAAATDPLTGAKLGAAVGCALVALPMYGCAVQLSRSRAIGLAAAVIATRSAGSAYLTIEFVKNGIGLTVALAALWAVLAALRQPTRARIGVALVGIVAAILAHKMAAALVIGIAVPAAFVEAGARGRLRGHRLIVAVAALALLAGIALVLGLLFPRRFLSPSDFALLRGAVSTTARWELPALALARPRLLGHEALLAALATVLAASGLVLTRGARGDHAAPGWAGLRVASWIVVGVGVLVGLPWLGVTDPNGLGYRIRIAAFVPLALATAIALHAWLAPVRAALRTGIALALALGAALHTPGSRTEGIVYMHPALITSVLALPSHVPAGATVILPERHILFMVAWYTHVPVRLRPEAVPPAHRIRVMPLGGFVLAGSPLDDALMLARNTPGVEPPVGLHPLHPNGLVLVTEPTWTWLLGQLSPKGRAYWGAWPTL